MAALGRYAATRVLSGALGLAFALALARWMPVPEFAAYALLLAAVSMAVIVGSLGIDRVLYRQLPQAHLARAHGQVLRQIKFALGARIAVAPPVAAAITYAWPPVQSTISPGLGLACSAAMAAALVVSDVLATAANSLLRFDAQVNITSATLVARMTAATAVYATCGQISAQTAVLIMLGGEVLLSVASFLLAVRPELRRMKADAARAPAVAYTPPPLRLLARAAGTNYVSYLFGLPWQGSTAIMLLGATTGVSEVAMFALLQNLLDRMRQYLPMQLLQNAFEPMLVRRYATNGNVGAVTTQVELLQRANFCILAGAVAVVLPCGSALLSWATGGRYADAGPLAALMLAALAWRSLTSALFISANVLNEMERLTLVSAGATVICLLPLVWSAQAFGAFGVVTVSVLPAWLLWAGLRAGSGHSAAGVWLWRKDAACALAAAVAAAAGFFVQTGVPGRIGTACAGAIAAAAYLLGIRALKVFAPHDVALLRLNLLGRER